MLYSSGEHLRWLPHLAKLWPGYQLPWKKPGPESVTGLEN